MEKNVEEGQDKRKKTGREEDGKSCSSMDDYSYIRTSL